MSFSVTVNYGQPSRTADIATARAKFSTKKADVVGAIMKAEETIPRSLDCVAYELKADGSRGQAVAQDRTENVIEPDVDKYNV